MSFGTLSDSSSGEDEVMNEINMTPLVDVMLVLLIIFIITVPVMNHAVPLDLPQASSQPEQVKPDSIQVSVDASWQYFWNEEPISDVQLRQRLAEAAHKTPQPELHIRGDKNTRYERIALLMSDAQQASLTRVGFVTDPASH